MTNQILVSLGLLAILGGNTLSHQSTQGSQFASSHMKEQGWVPVTMTQPATAEAGSTFVGTVTLMGAPTQDEVVSLGTNSSSCFAYLPATVTVPAGSTSVSFSATFATAVNGNVSITASACGGSVKGSTYVWFTIG